MPLRKNGSVRLPAFAKINLCLHVVGRRPDGYHELRTIFQAISLRDTLELSRTSKPGIFLETDDAELPAGPENLVYRAIDALGCEIGIRGGIRARLEKRIPVARGLGGGSSDAAAALIGMLRLTKKKIPLERLMQIASGLGADVPFFLFGGRALAVNRGDEIYPLDDAPKRTIVVVSPRNIGVSTKDAYQWLSAELTNRAKPPRYLGVLRSVLEPAGNALERFRGARFQPPSATRRNPIGIAQARSRRMPRWRVAGRRCLEYSETQRRRAEPLGRSRKIRFSSSKPFPGKSMAARLGWRVAV